MKNGRGGALRAQDIANAVVFAVHESGRETFDELSSPGIGEFLNEKLVRIER